MSTKFNIFDPAVSDEALAEWVKASLRPREIEMLVLLGFGYISKQIAIDLNINERTVETHRHNLRKTLGIRTSAEQTVLAWRIRNFINRPIHVARTKSGGSVIDNVDNSLR